MADLAPGGCSCLGACDPCDEPATPQLSDDPMASMRIGDLRLMVDYVAHTNAYRRFEARVMAAELDPVGAANARFGGGQRRSLPILDPIDDPAHGPMPVHPADLEPFVKQEILFDRGPREIDEPRVIEEEFLRLEAAGLEAPDVPLDQQPPRLSDADPIPQLDDPCPMPDATTDLDVDWAVVRTGPGDSLQHRHYHPPNQVTVHRNLIVMLPGGAGNPGNVHEQSLWMAQAGFRVLTLDWNASQTTASTECRFDEDGERRPDLTDEELNACLIEVREHKNHNPDDGVVTSLVSALLLLTSSHPAQHWDEFLTSELEVEMFGIPRVASRPNWDRIVLAGYSEGANQAAYDLRQFPVYGAIMVSGGGDFGQVDPQPPPTEASLADWMVPLSPDDRRMAMYNHEEGAEAAFLVGWDVDGVPDTQSIATPDEPFYDSFHDANRLCHSCDMDLVGPSCPEPSVEAIEASCDPHLSVISGDPRLKPAWMYMACRAGRV